MILKRFFFTILMTSCVFLYAEENNTEIDIQRYQNIIYTILTNFNNIIGNNQVSEIVYSTYISVENAIRNNNVTFKIDPKKGMVLGGMSFDIHESGEVSLVFGIKYLDTYNLNSSTHYSILIHEYRHLYDYLTNKTAFIDAKTNEKEKYWYELDALRIEAEFIKYYLVGKYNLSRFEEYILYSFENNNLNTASIFLKKESMNIFFYFNDMEIIFVENRISKDEIIMELEQMGYRLLANYCDDDENYISFMRYIEISTFRRYLIRILPIIINNNETTWGEVFEQYPEIEKIYDSMGEILSNNNTKQTEYLNSVYKNWENDIMNIN